MTSEIKSFVDYLRDMKKASKNTEIPYQRDLTQLAAYLEDKRITEVAKTTRTSLNFYILFLEKEGRAITTVSRESASIKAFFGYLFRGGMIRRDPVELLKAPRIEKKTPVILSVNEVNALLEQPGTASVKKICDKAMLELLYATRTGVSELIGPGLKDLNMQVDYTTCRDGQKERMVPLGKNAEQVMAVHLERGGKESLKGSESEWLFTDCSGEAMSRQGSWKTVKYYGEKAGIEVDITPHTLRRSFAAYLIRGGADVHAVQAMLGRSDPTTTRIHVAYSGSMMGETYKVVLRRK